jgi:proteasomal ATPase-associated factor 1
MQSTLTILPIATIQPDFNTVIDEVRTGVVPFDTFWVSCYKTSEPSVHAKVHVELDENDRDLVRLHPKDGDVDVVWDRVS